MNASKFLHYRFLNEETGEVEPRMGATVAYRFTTGGNVKYAVAYCHPYDNYNKRLGRVKAAGRLNSPTYALDTTFKDAKEFVSEMDRHMFASFGYVRP